jgi:ribosomal protein S18 acetylase RimI-like enzyme
MPISGGSWREAMGDGVIRRARVDDASSIGAVHVAAWREAYAGLLPACLLRSLSVEEAVEKWRETLTGPPSPKAVFVALRGDRSVTGFGCCGPQRTAKLRADGYGGEFEAIYLLAADQRQGFGRRLMAEMARALMTHGLDGASLWVLRDNQPARAFYEAIGGRLIGSHVEMRKDIAFHEVAYGWSDLADLAAA